MVSCVGDQKVEFPISNERMVELEVDMHYIEAIVQKTEKRKRDSVRNSLKNQIIGIYGFKSIEDLDSLLFKLQSYPVINKKVVDEVESVLDSLEKTMKKKKPSSKEDLKYKDSKSKKEK